MARVTQSEKILKYIEEKGYITPLAALREFGRMRIASRRRDLKKMGYNVRREMETSKNRNGEPVLFARCTICN